MKQDRRPECPQCGAKNGKECARVECGNRRQITAQPPSDSVQNWGSGSHRRTPIDREERE